MAAVAELTGQVTSIKSRDECRVFCPNSGKSYNVRTPFFCPLKEKDTIHGHCRIDSATALTLIRPPFVQPAVDREAVVQVMIRALRKGYQVINRLYTQLAQQAGGEDKVVTYLGEISQGWQDNRDPTIFDLLPGLNMEQGKKLLEFWYRDRELRRLYLLGLNRTEIKACQQPCSVIYERCLKNPYAVAPVPLEKADDIQHRLGVAIDPVMRYRGTIVRTVYKNLNESGWISTPLWAMTRSFPDFLTHKAALLTEYGLVEELDSFYLPFPVEVERFLTEYIKEKVESDPITINTPLDQQVESKGQLVERHSIRIQQQNPSPDQVVAVQGAVDHKISIMTGGAGTGKTTCIRELVHNLELRGTHYLLTSFTGKAVARIREVTKRMAATIHRLISSARNGEETPGLHLVIDESSMLTAELFYRLIKAYPTIDKITLVGDVNQLPPIGWGALFASLIASGTVPTYYLTTNHRTYDVAGELCGIVGNANRIVTNRYNILELIPTSNFTVMEGGVPRVVDIIKACKGGNVPARDIVVLSPFNRPLPELNAWFQEIYNPDGVAVIDSRKRTWKINDLVMLTENLAEDSVYNGDIGVITAVDPLKVTVDFDAKPGLEFLLEPTISEREYRTDEEEEFRVLEKTVKLLASGHALTVDKSQGSEWQFVVVYIDAFTASSFLNRRRIYTAITRAKRAVWLVVADVEALQVSAAKNLPYRHENLPKRLKAVLPQIPPYKPAAPVTSLHMEDDDEGWEEDPAWAD